MKASLIATFLALALAVPTFAGGARTPFGNTPGSNTPGGRTNVIPGTNGLTGTNSLRNTPNRLGAPTGTGRQQPLTESYNILETTSIFSITRGTGRGSGSGNGGDEIITPPPPHRIPAPAFRASMVDDIGPLALLEVPDARGAITPVYLREGQTWNGYKVLGISLDTLRLSRGGVSTISISIGNDLNGSLVGSLPTSSSYQSADVLGVPRTTTPNARPGRNNFRGSTVTGNPATGNPIIGVTSTLVSPTLDPPLPAGSADDIATRMANRRLIQLYGTSPTTPNTSTTPPIR